ncbi:MAG: hypothetical protein KGQ70_06850, partial [Alphaproteobacteria bacterium]|nr:hypothetical protein [Alphaproteobacteria bacterium]
MKKYLTVAVVLSIIAVVGVSYLARADQAAPAPAPAPAPAAATAPAAAAPAATAPVAGNYAKDSAECDALAAAPAADGKVLTDAEKAGALKKCLLGKGYTQAQIDKES